MRKLLVLAAALALSLGMGAVQASAQYLLSNEPAPSANDNYGGATYQYRRSNASPIPRQTVSFAGNHKPGTIIIKTSERRLYYTLGDGRAIKYAVGVGRQGFTWSGSNTISRKAEWPGWTPPAQMRARERAKGRILPAYQKGGPNNPLGARAMYIGSTLYRIHGTNQPSTIGQAMSSGCIRMANDDVIHLYNQVKIGARVIVQH